MVYVPAGEFLMGRDNPKVNELPVRKTPEHPQHRVWVDAFYIDKYEVTNAQFEQFQAHERHWQSPCDDCPVTKVSWFSAGKYCKFKSKRLPTEAEWEKAAKGGVTEDPAPLVLYAWIFGNSDNHTHPVGQKRPNGYGLYDMLGNVREWVEDCHQTGYDGAPADGSVREHRGACEKRVVRGGAWIDGASTARAAYRYAETEDFRNYQVGFRVVRDLDQ